MRFSLNLACILPEMANEHGETMEDLGIDWREVAEMLIKGEIEFEIISDPFGYYLVIDVSDKFIKR